MSSVTSGTVSDNGLYVASSKYSSSFGQFSLLVPLRKMAPFRKASVGGRIASWIRVKTRLVRSMRVVSGMAYERFVRQSMYSIDPKSAWHTPGVKRTSWRRTSGPKTDSDNTYASVNKVSSEFISDIGMPCS